MIALSHRGASHLVVAWLILGGGTAYGQTQTPGQVTKFDPSLNIVDSVITEDPSGNIGIGTTAPVAALDVATGDLNLSGNILKSGGLFIHNFGLNNTFMGSAAGNLTMTGNFNTAIGSASLTSNTTGFQNAASGAFALVSNTTGYANTATGGYALYHNIDGGFNTAVGAEALISNINGNSNTASGVDALQMNMNGYSNTAIGVFALRNNIDGYVNTAAGAGALNANTSGFNNTAVGDALESNTTGHDNTASGFQTLQNNTTGSFNTAIGRLADVAMGNLVNATAIGADAIVDASNKIRLGNTAVSIIEGQVPYTFTSDKNQKENFRSIDGKEVLRKLSSLKVASWNYIGHDPEQFRHYGPVAQEFFAAFGQDGVGTVGTPTTINSGDLEGILMIAVQALEKQNRELRTRIEALERLVKGTTGEIR